MTFEELKQLVESNAKAIQAQGEQMTTARLTAEVERQELRDAMIRITNLTETITTIVVSLDSDRPTILSKLSKIESKIDTLLKNKEN